ncbi:unnamed protein product [Polarella glacialis]|uniref:Uncharacterized protein n=1 Tax=Polarella glacialis TaxID=89957 RepID=A0A813FRD3_POLGL|nr:unnamed protein product [Polarella glacialis]CAE8689261.1 unnamed protein product [Polarella glacialis]
MEDRDTPEAGDSQLKKARLSCQGVSRQTPELSNSTARLLVDLAGGGLAAFELHNNSSDNNKSNNSKNNSKNNSNNANINNNNSNNDNNSNNTSSSNNSSNNSNKSSSNSNNNSSDNSSNNNSNNNNNNHNHSNNNPNNLNPLNWDSAVHDGEDATSLAPRPLGHFLCLDRWGPPSEAEEARGMPFHGEASSVPWQILAAAAAGSSAQFGALLPMAGLEVSRSVKLVAEAGLAVIAERVTNVKDLGRIYNMVQHPTIAAPFLDGDTVVDCNGKRGFAQVPPGELTASPDTPNFEFPVGKNSEGCTVNARQMTGGGDDVLSYEVAPGSKHGWVCATSAKKGMLLGYIWPAADYPWISLWCCSGSDGSARARALEFGTTGLHHPFPTLVRHPMLLDLPTFAHLDAGESCTRRYAVFVVPVPPDFQGVAEVSLSGDGEVTVLERTGRVEIARRITVCRGAGDLFVQ